MNRPRALDLFAGAGGAGMGYSRAGFDVYGVDIDPQPRNPFPFYQGDALVVMRRLLLGEAVPFTHRDGRVEWLTLSDFAAIHASPPCQGYTALNSGHKEDWPLLIEPVRDLLDEIGKPYVIENVQGAPLRRDLTLCGEMFGLGVIRHRYFELGNWQASKPLHVPHRGRVSGWRHGEFFEGPYVAVYGKGGGKATVEQARVAMDIDWMTELHDLVECVPPAYTEFIGQQLLEVI